MINQKIYSGIFGCCFLILTFTLLSHPQEAFAASLRGLNLWWTIVFPALLPFFVLSEILVAFGVVHLIGTLLEPIMRPFFRLPGISGYVLAMSMASGSPSGARITTQLLQENQLTPKEAQRLILFTNTANPLFIFGAVAIGFFNNPKIGLLLAIVHYTSSILIGLFTRFYDKKTNYPKNTFGIQNLKKSFLALHTKRITEQRPFGKILGDAVTNSVHILLMIGGFIMMFSVLNVLLETINLFPTIEKILHHPITLIGVPSFIITPFLSGLLEMTLGIQNISTTTIPLESKLIIISFLLGFSGLSIHAQVATILSNSGIRYFPYLLARIAHGIIASLLTYVFIISKLVPYQINKTISTVIISGDNTLTNWQFVSHLGPVFTLLILYVYLLLRFIQQRKKNIF